MLAWGLIGAFLAMSPALAFATLEKRLKVVLIFLVVLNAIRSEEQLWIYLLVYVGSFMIYPARGTLINFIHHHMTNHRVAWNFIYDNPNDDAAMTMLAAGAALSIAMAEVQSRALRKAAWGCAAILVLAVLVTESRGAFVGLVLGLGLPFLRLVRRRVVIVYAAVGAVAALTVLPHRFYVRMEGLKDLTSVSTIRQADKSGSAEQRWQIQLTGLRIFFAHPLLGVGLGCYPLANAKFSPDLGARDAHNTYLRLGAETGLPGLLLWVALVVAVLKQVRRAERGPGRLKMVDPKWLKYGLFAFLVEGIFGSYSDLTILYMVLGTVWSAATLMLNEDRTNEPARTVARVS